jgi:hypothetical protein
MNILFTGIGGPTPIGIAKSIKDVWPSHRLIGVDASEWAPSFYQSDVFSETFKVPNAQSPEYWNAIEQVVKVEKIDFAFVVPETEVLIWAKRALVKALPCPTHIPSTRLAEFCFDKLKVAKILFDQGLSPLTIEVPNEISNGINLGIEYPFWIRIKSGAGALGALKINDYKDLQTWLALHSEKNGFIASEFLPGRNYACKLLYFDNQLVLSASAERIDYLLSAAAPSGISGMCARGRLLNRPDLVEKSKTALELISVYLNLPLNGMFTIDFKENKGGDPLITEINIRHVSFTYAFTLGGINFAEKTLKAYFDNSIRRNDGSTFNSEDYFIRGVDAPLRLVKESELKLD